MGTKLTKIRLLESEEGSDPAIRDYLVEDEMGNKNVLNTVELILDHAFDFVYYLQNRTKVNKL
jgi:hypothetical protein